MEPSAGSVYPPKRSFDGSDRFRTLLDSGVSFRNGLMQECSERSHDSASGSARCRFNYVCGIKQVLSDLNTEGLETSQNVL